MPWAKIKDILTGALVIMALLIFVPSLGTASILPALVLIVLILLVGVSFKLNQPTWGWIFLALTIVLVLLWFIPGTQFTLPNLSF